MANPFNACFAVTCYAESCRSVQSYACRAERIRAQSRSLQSRTFPSLDTQSHLPRCVAPIRVFACRAEAGLLSSLGRATICLATPSQEKTRLLCNADH